MQQQVPHVGALLAVLAPEGLGKHSTGLEKSISAWAWGTQLLWHSQLGHGLKVPRKALGGRQAATPERGTTPAKPRPRGTWMVQLVLQMRKKRWWPLRDGTGGCLSCRPGCSAHQRPGLVLQESWLLLEKFFPEGAKPKYHPKIHLSGAVTTSWSNSCSQGLPSHLIKVLSFSIPQKCCPHAVISMGPDFSLPGVPCPAGAPLWQELSAWDCRTGL